MEYYLAHSENGNYFPLLFSSYFKTKNKYAKSIILESLQRAFPDIQGKNDDEFVKNAQMWYTKNRDDFIINKYYYSVSAPVMPSDTNLFILKEKYHDWESRNRPVTLIGE